MGGTEEKDKHGDEVEKKDKKKEKPEEADGKEEKSKDKKKKKDKDGKEKEKKNPEDKKDPASLKQKLEKLDTKIQVLVAKKEEILKLLKEVEQGGATEPPVASS